MKDQIYPWVSIDITQNPQKYAVHIQVAEGISVTYSIEPHNLKWLEKDIKSIRDVEASLCEISTKQETANP